LWLPQAELAALAALVAQVLEKALEALELVLEEMARAQVWPDSRCWNCMLWWDLCYRVHHCR